MSVRKVLLNGLFIAVIASCAALAACGSGKAGNCEACSANADCTSGNCATFQDSNGANKTFLCADSSTSNCSVTK